MICKCTNSQMAEIACVAHGGRLPQVIEGCSITTATTDGF